MPPAPQRPSSGGRNFQMQKRKSVKMHPVVGVTLFLVIPGILIAVFAVALASRNESKAKSEVAPPDPNHEIEAIVKQVGKAQRLYQNAAALRDGDDHAAFKAKLKEATNFINDLLERFDAILEPKRDPVTGQLPAEFSGYSVPYNKLQTWINDLYKQTGFFDD